MSVVASMSLQTHRAYAAADTCTWTGAGSDSNLSTAANWTGCDNGHTPQTGDSLVFPAGPTNKTVTLDFEPLFDSVTLSGNGYTLVSPGVEEIGMVNDLTISGNNNTFNTRVRFFSTDTSTITHSGMGTNFMDTIVVQPQSPGTNVVVDTVSDLAVPNIAQAGSNDSQFVIKTGAATLSVVGQASPVAGFRATGGLNIDEGTWRCNDSNCLGDTGHSVIICGATLEMAVNTTESHDIATCLAPPAASVLKVSAPAVTFSGSLTVNASLATILAATTNTTFSGGVSISDGELLSVQGGSGYATNAATFDGVVSGNGDFIVDNAHVTLAATNTYTGSTELHHTGGGAVLTATSAAALGSAAHGTSVASGTTLQFTNNVDDFSSEPISVEGTGVGGSYPGALVKSDQYMDLAGPITLTGDTTMHNATSELFILAGTISGAHNLTLTGIMDNGGFGVQPSSSNNSFGNLIANGIQLLLGGAGKVAAPQNVTLNAVNGKLSRIWLNDSSATASDSVIAINNDGSEIAYLLNISVNATIGSITGNGTIFMDDASSRFNIGHGNTSGTFSGVVQGFTGSIFQIIGGTWTFNGRNVDNGNGYSTYQVNGGKFVVHTTDASLGSSPFTISSGTLGGTGTIGPLIIGAATLAPGNSPGCLNVNGNLTFTSITSHYTVDIAGNTVCTQYDQVSASGTVTLNGATLDAINLTFNSQPGDVYTIITGAAISGTFANLANGATITAGSHIFKINYTATTVTLTDISPVSASGTLTNTGEPLRTAVLAAIALSVAAGAVYLGPRLKRNSTKN